MQMGVLRNMNSCTFSGVPRHPQPVDCCRTITSAVRASQESNYAEQTGSSALRSPPHPRRRPEGRPRTRAPSLSAATRAPARPPPAALGPPHPPTPARMFRFNLGVGLGLAATRVPGRPLPAAPGPPHPPTPARMFRFRFRVRNSSNACAWPATSGSSGSAASSDTCAQLCPALRPYDTFGGRNVCTELPGTRMQPGTIMMSA